MILSKEDYKNLETIYEYLTVRDPITRKADAIIAGGAGIRVDMAERAAELYNKGYADLVIFSGFTHPDFIENEACILANKAEQLGVPISKIIMEPRASNVAENILFPAKILQEKGINVQNVILVHRPFMTRRFKGTAEAQWPQPQPEFFVTCVNDSFSQYIERESEINLVERTVWSMLEEYKRITEYAENGWQTPQPRGNNAERAFRQLVNAGFTIR